jgi:hypothetical protein
MNERTAASPSPRESPDDDLRVAGGDVWRAAKARI